MALPTMAQWTDAWRQLTLFPSLGQLYQEHAHIFRAFGVPMRVNPGQIRVNWTDGGVAGSVEVTAGAPTGTSVAPAKVDDTFNLDFGAVAGQAYTDIGIDMMGAGFESNLSIQKAVTAIYDEWVNQITGSLDGDDYEMWGAQNFFAEAAVIAAGMISSGGATLANLLKEIDIATASLPSTGYNICLTDKQGYNGVKAAVRALGGTNPDHTSEQDFGYSTLFYDGVAFFHTRHMEDTGTSPTEDSDFYFYNIGPEGCQVVSPNNGDIFEVQGPKVTKGEFNQVWDIALKTQLVYTSPRAAYHLKNQNMT